MSIERIYLTIVKAVLDKPTANIILGSEKLKAFPLKIRNKTGMSTVTTFFFQQNCKKRKRNKRNPNWKGRSKSVTVCR